MIVKGKILSSQDREQNPINAKGLPNAIIMEKGNDKNFKIADDNGKFQITIPSGKSIYIQSVGFKAQEFKPIPSNFTNFYLDSTGETNLDEVVVEVKKNKNYIFGILGLLALLFLLSKKNK